MQESTRGQLATAARRRDFCRGRLALGAALALSFSVTVLAAAAEEEEPAKEKPAEEKSAKEEPAKEKSARLRRIGHLLNRAAHGPTRGDVKRIMAMGIDAWIEAQLHPESIDESSNTALNRRIAALKEKVVHTEDRRLIARGDLWRYHKGTTAPPLAWNRLEFDASAWLEGPSGFGYGDGDDLTVLEDMRGKYSSVFIRRRFTVTEPELAAFRDLVLSVNYDDGFIAYLNGTEVARRNIAGPSGSPVPPSAFSSAITEAEGFEDIGLTAPKKLLRVGDNVIAFQVHNRSLTSSDLSIIPRLLDRKILPGPTRMEIKGIEELKALAHVYAVYSRRQLQTVLAEFWENHFTTDFDKVAESLDGLTNSDASDALSPAQARKEAARLEHREFEFFREHALGNFGDLLRHSATSPTMLIYLDNVLNVNKNANENYAREILELHTFGADNGYAQVDIEQLSKCFTGWAVCKVSPENLGKPHSPCGVQVDDTVILAAGDATGSAGKDWRYLKGTAEPPAAWKDPGFDDSDWPRDPGGIGYGDDDDATVLSDMRNNYTTVYLRKTFRLSDPGALKNFILSIDIDDGFVAYLNGHEAVRFNAPGKSGSPVPFDASTKETHEAGGERLQFNLNWLRRRLVAGENVFAIHALNRSKTSSDLSVSPTLLDREVLPGSIENGDPRGVWSFHFFPDRHNAADGKTLFKGSSHQLDVPAGRSGTEGILDAEDAIERILDHPSTALFISSKLIQRFAGDEIDFRNPSKGPYADLMKRCVSAWNSTTPKGNIRVVMKAILTSPEFWSERSYRSKVKDPFEYIASTARVLEAQTSGMSVVRNLRAMAMELFTRDDPDGWPEIGSELMDTNTLRNRIAFARNIAAGTPPSSPDLHWDARLFLDADDLSRAEKIVSFFDDLLFEGTLTAADEALVTEFIATDDAYAPRPLERERADFEGRVRRALGMMLSLPQWQFQ